MRPWKALSASSATRVRPVCANRIFVQDGIYDASRETGKAVAAMKQGSGFILKRRPDLIMGRAVDKVAEHVDDAVEHGVKLVVGGERTNLTDKGTNWSLRRRQEVQPTPKPADADLCGETFGPVAPLFRWKVRAGGHRSRQQHRIRPGRLHNLYARDLERVWRVAEESWNTAWSRSTKACSLPSGRLRRHEGKWRTGA